MHIGIFIKVFFDVCDAHLIEPHTGAPVTTVTWPTCCVSPHWCETAGKHRRYSSNLFSFKPTNTSAAALQVLAKMASVIKKKKKIYELKTCFF